MCVVSMVGDHYRDKWKDKDWFPVVEPQEPNGTSFTISTITREEFDALKREVLEMKELLKRAKVYDAANNEPNCEMDEKMALLRKIAEAVGINLDDVIGK